ncbi:ABC transporter permease [Jonesiaceae bacterium BS-20]|uniref:Transport permease protein n=1 Tax=Jonesiaceae bacterium BS-20 TaxID=3120821 RepID=A0AAU7DXI9_9MICO
MTKGITKPMTERATLTSAELAAKYGLQPMGVRPPLMAYCRDVLQRREFLMVLSQSKVQASNRNTYLGYIWSVLTPLLNSLVYVLIFGVLLGTRDGMSNVIGYIVVGTFMYGFFSGSVNGAAKSIKGNLRLVQSMQFPRVIIPISVVGAEILALVPALVVMFVISQMSVGFVQGWDQLNPERWILIVPALLMLFVFSTGIGLIMAQLASRIPDILNFLPFVIRIGMYASGVIFAIEHQVREGLLLTIMQYQPVAIYLNLGRQAMLSEGGIQPDLAMWGIGLGWAVLTFAVGFIIFWRDEARYGRD